MANWQVQDAKARFSELLDTSIKKGPQVVTRRGVEAAVLVSITQWRLLQKTARPDLKSLLTHGPRFDDVIPPRRGFKLRSGVDFSE